MKNIILSLFIAVFAVQMLTAATVSIQQVSNAVPGTGLAVAVTGNFSGVTNGVTAFQFDISIDDACLVAPVIQNSVFAGIQSNLITSTTLRVIWVDYTAHNVTNGNFSILYLHITEEIQTWISSRQAARLLLPELCLSLLLTPQDGFIW